MTQKEIQQKLFSMQDIKYKEFHSKLIPTVSKETIIGVRTPQLRKLAKEIRKGSKWQKFLSELPHEYYEENNLHAFLIELETDYERCVEEMNRFLPYIDNWATCDMLRPKCFKGNKAELLTHIEDWLMSKHTYTIRFGIEMLMVYYLDEDFDDSFLYKIADIHHTDYYVKMMIAWYFATALAKQWDKTIVYLEQQSLEEWVHNKTIQKALESRRITEEQKTFLRTLKV